MKKIFYSLLAALALSCTFTACSEHDGDDVSTPYASNPAQAAAGTYSGQFSRVQIGTTDTTYAQGTLVLEATSAYAGNVTFTANDMSLSASSAVNVSFDSNGYTFANQLTNNGLGAKFAGKVAKGSEATAWFTLSQRIGRTLYEFQYNFKGTK
jgi:hypothetical protein